MYPTNPPATATFPTVFAHHVAAHPARPAIVTTNDMITYAALNEQANRIAAALYVHGAHDQVPICLLFGQEIAAFAATIAVLQSGNFYVALDPLYPPARLAEIIVDTGAALLLTNAAGLALARQCCPTGVQILSIDTLPVPTTPPPTRDLLPDAYAYIGYTSGSTGKAKGVIETHRNHLWHWQNLMRAQPTYGNERVLFLNRLSFSGGQLAFYLTLLAGATLYLYDLQQDGLAALPGWIQQHQITVWNSVPSVFRAFTEHLESPAQVASLRLLRLASDTVLPADLAAYQRWFAPSCQLWLGYALTEVKTVTMAFLDQACLAVTTEVPNGPPIAGMAIQIVDEQGERLGPNQVGEIVVRSRYVSPGYWRAPALTAARFQPDPTEPGVWLVQTGDLGKLDQHGQLIHKGRKDTQVKIRGYRVELSEIEAHLGALEGIQAAAVRTFPLPSGEVRLAAYLVSHHTPPPTTSQLRQGLSQRLPDYMIPASFTLLDTLPVNTNGKVDRALLPPPSKSRPPLVTPFVPPQTDLERALAALWAEQLAIDAVGVDDDFFALGGDSLLAMRVTLASATQLGITVPIAFFRQPTIAHLVTLLTSGADAGPASPTTPPRSSPRLAAVRRITAQLSQSPQPLRALRRRIGRRVGAGLAAQAFHRPYREGVQWLLAWCKAPAVQRLCYAQDRQELCTFAQQMGAATAQLDAIVQRALASRLLQRHFEAQLQLAAQQPGRPLTKLATELRQGLQSALLSPTWQRYVTVSGLEYLTAAREARQRVILVGPHTNANYVVRSLAHHFSPLLIVSEAKYKQIFAKLLADTGITYAAGRQVARAVTAIEAQQVLQRGGLVSINGDEEELQAGLRVTVGGRVRHLVPGFAELAVATGAIILPIGSALQADGRLAITIRPPLTWESRGGRTAQVAQIMQGYSVALTELWREEPSMIDPRNLRLQLRVG